MHNHDELQELVLRARAERSLYLADLIADAIFSAHRFIQRAISRLQAPRKAKSLHRVPAPQR